MAAAAIVTGDPPVLLAASGSSMGRVEGSSPALDAAYLARELVTADGLWSRIEVVAETDSTNTDVAVAARAGQPQGLVRVAESQRAGRGRLDRQWQAPSGAALTLSVLLRPGPAVAVTRLGWLPLLTGVAVARACAAVAGPAVEVGLKWPNDILLRPGTARSDQPSWGKCGGILAEVAEPGSVVVGIGLNVAQRADELPAAVGPGALPPTSLHLAGVSVPRGPLAVAVLRELATEYGRWLGSRGEPVECGLWQAYRGLCRTLGEQVAVSLPGSSRVTGVATDIDQDGRLLVTTGGAGSSSVRALAAGDVQHVRGSGQRRSP